MSGEKSGFTILETVLVLAIATLLFMSVAIGIGGRISSGRYETAANEITDYLRDVYAETLNVENQRVGVEGARRYCTLYGSVPITENGETTTGSVLTAYKGRQDNNWSNTEPTDVYPGRTDCAIYGKIIFFGAEPDEIRDDNGVLIDVAERIHAFDIVGDVITADKKPSNGTETIPSEVETLQNKSIEEQLNYVRADYLALIPESTGASGLAGLSDTSCHLAAAASHTTYTPNWGAIEKTANRVAGRSENTDFVGFVMVVRAPASGDVHTFFYESPTATRWDFTFLNDPTTTSCSLSSSEYNSHAESSYYSPLKLRETYRTTQDALAEDQRDQNTGFCISSDDFYITISNIKKYVGFFKDGQNASAVKLDESEDNPCRS